MIYALMASALSQVPSGISQKSTAYRNHCQIPISAKKQVSSSEYLTPSLGIPHGCTIGLIPRLNISRDLRKTSEIKLKLKLSREAQRHILV